MDEVTDNLVNNGFTKLNGVFTENLMNEVASAIDSSYEICRQIQIKNNVAEATDGTVHHLLAYGDDVYIQLLEKFCASATFELATDYFNGNFILNSYGGLKNFPANPSYVTKMHRDIRFFSSGLPLMLNVLIMVDDFTMENGATYLLSGSHFNDDRPTDDNFYKQADRATGKKGDVLIFNSNLWHAAGVNRSHNERKAITITLTKPFMKQQLDYSKAVGYDEVEKSDPKLQQLLGYYSRVPKNLDEWYRPVEQRFYRRGQD